MAPRTVTLRCGHPRRMDLRGGSAAILRALDRLRHGAICTDCQGKGLRPHDFPSPRG